MDKTDKRILEVLQGNARLTNQEVADRAGISSAACWRRMRALENDGVIRSYRAVLDRQALALNLSVYVHISLSRHEAGNVAAFEEAVLKRPEVLECHSTTGDADFLLKVVTRDIGSYDRFLSDFLFTLPGIAQVKSNITLREIKSGGHLPLELAGVTS